MKRNSAVLLSTLLACLFLSLYSCEPDGAEIGDLYGRWHLRQASCNNADIAHHDTLFISFQGNAYQYQAGWGHHDWGSYVKTSDSLTLLPLAYGGNFTKMGIDVPADTPVCFRLQTLTDNELTIARHDSIWSFRKFLE